MIWELPLFAEVPAGVSRQHWFDHSNLKAEFTDRALQSLTLMDVNAQYVQIH